VGEWAQYAEEHGEPAAVALAQRYRRPADIPPKKRRLTDAEDIREELRHPKVLPEKPRSPEELERDQASKAQALSEFRLKRKQGAVIKS